jgi:hypothetical protein
VKKILELPNSKNQTMISFDVDNLYTNVLVNEALKITSYNLFKGKNQPPIPFDRTQLKELLGLAVCDIPFRFLDNT